MLTSNDLSAITKIVQNFFGPLDTKVSGLDGKIVNIDSKVSSLDTKITKLDVNMNKQFSELKNKTTKDVKKLEAAIKTQRKINNDDFGHLEKEDRKTLVRVEKIERHLGFASA